MTAFQYSKSTWKPYALSAAIFLGLAVSGGIRNGFDFAFWSFATAFGMCLFLFLIFKRSWYVKITDDQFLLVKKTIFVAERMPLLTAKGLKEQRGGVSIFNDAITLNVKLKLLSEEDGERLVRIIKEAIYRDNVGHIAKI